MQRSKSEPSGNTMSIDLSQWDISIIGDYYKNDPAMQQAFESTVADLINTDIASRQSGRLVLGRVRSSRGIAEIYPRYEAGRNAEATFKLKANGRGYDLETIIIWYKPQQWSIQHPKSRQTIPNDLRAFQPAHLRDEVLFHELVHAGRLLDGFWPQKAHKLKPDPDQEVPYANNESAAYDDIEEFVSVLVTNIYLSEKGAKVFRASHGADGYPFILDQAQSTSEGFLQRKSNRDLVQFFCQTDPIAPYLSEIDTPFNPVRAHYRQRPQDLVTNAYLQQK